MRAEAEAARRRAAAGLICGGNLVNDALRLVVAEGCETVSCRASKIDTRHTSIEIGRAHV